MQYIDSYAWIMITTNLLGMIFYLAMLVYVCLAKSDGSGAKRLAVIGVALLIFGRATQWLAAVLAAQISLESIFTIQIVGQAISGLIHCIAMALIVAAVFKGRQPGSKPGIPDSVFTGSADGHAAKHSTNPYAIPTAQPTTQPPG